MPIKEVDSALTLMQSVSETWITDLLPTPHSSYGHTVLDSRSVPTASWKRIWARTDNWRALLASGAAKPENGYVFEAYSRPPAGVVKMERSSSEGPIYRRDVLTYSTLYFSSVSAGSEILTDFGVKNKLLEKARGNQWNVPVFIAELGKTSEMVYKRALHITHLIRAVRRGDFRSFYRGLHPQANLRLDERKLAIKQKAYGSNAAKAAADTWLEAKYGWIPFIEDVRSAVITLEDISDRDREKAYFTVRARDEMQTRRHRIGDAMESPKLRATFEEVINESYRGVWRFKVLPEDVPGRLGLLNPLEVAWELVPLSFVADWFLPIGDYLASFGDSRRFTHLSGSIGYRRHTERKVGEWSSPEYPLTYGPTQRTDHVYVRRTSLEGPPDLSILQMRFKNPFPDHAKIATSLSLLTQQASRLRRG